MARINIDDQFWLDLMGVVAQLGDQDKAIGQAVRFFRMAQEKHKHGKLVSEEDFKRAGFSEALIGTFAERVDGGIQAVGAQKHFGWLAKRVEAGRAGGSSKTEAKTSKLKQNRSKTEASPSPSYSSSSSQSPKKNNAQPDGFATFWAGFPNKKGKSKAKKLYAKALSSGASPEDILRARDRYIADCKANGTEKQFIQQGPRFMGEWEDWLDPETGQAEDFASAAGTPGYRTMEQILADDAKQNGGAA